MKLIFKFAILMVIPLAGLVFTFYESQRALDQLAEDHVEKQANLLMDAAVAARWYTTDHIKNLLSNRPVPGKFIKETVPAFAAKEALKHIFSKGNYEDYSYKEAATYPTIKADEADTDEQELIRYFNEHTNKEVRPGTPRSKPDLYYFARPIRPTLECMDCHDTKARAQSKDVVDKYGDMVALYGEDKIGGFNWQVGNVEAVQVVYVPKAAPERIAREAANRILIAIVGAGVLTIVALWWALAILVIRPVARLSALAEQISRGQLNSAQLPVRGTDEIAKLTEAFNRMTLSLYKAVKRLKGS